MHVTADRSHDLPGPFRRLYDDHLDFVWRNLRRLGVVEADLEDATQETFVTAHRRRASFRAGASIRAWLYGITRRVAFRYRRGLGRRHRLKLAMLEERSTSFDPIPLVEGREAGRLLERFIAGLAAPQREVFVLAECEGLRGWEIAEALHINPNTVGSRLRAARAAFQRYLETLEARERGERLRLQRALVQHPRDHEPGAEQRSTIRRALAVQFALPSRGWTWSALSGARAAVAAVVLGASGGAAVALFSSTESAPTVLSISATTETVPPAPPRLAGRASDALSALRTPIPVPTAGPPSPGPSGGRRRSPSHPPQILPTSAPDALAAATSSVAATHTAVIGGDYERGLRLADAHHRTHGELLGAEARALRIRALCGLGRETEARRDAVALGELVPRHRWASVASAGCPSAKKSTNRPAAGEEPGI